jgi:hypothetical protein
MFTLLVCPAIGVGHPRPIVLLPTTVYQAGLAYPICVLRARLNNHLLNRALTILFAVSSISLGKLLLGKIHLIELQDNLAKCQYDPGMIVVLLPVST